MLMMPLLTNSHPYRRKSKELGVSSQVKHRVLAYCIWWRAGNARLAGLPQDHVSLTCCWDDGRSQAGRVHQGCGAQGMQQRTRHCC